MHFFVFVKIRLLARFDFCIPYNAIFFNFAFHMPNKGDINIPMLDIWCKVGRGVSRLSSGQHPQIDPSSAVFADADSRTWNTAVHSSRCCNTISAHCSALMNSVPLGTGSVFRNCP